ncbi:MAG: response regulator transcription factor [Myxococcaceae bacterium]
MSETAPVVHVVDDDPSFLASMSRLLRAAGYAVRTFSSAEALLAQVADTPGCVVADLQMPGLSGLDLQDALQRAGHTLPVVFLTGQGDIPTSVHAMRQGAEDFLTKHAPKEKLLETVQRALGRDVRQRAERTRGQDLRARFDVLTPREREVLQHVIRGQLNKQIAADLGIHERTVKLHRTAITRKLHVHSVAELTLLVREASIFG